MFDIPSDLEVGRVIVTKEAVDGTELPKRISVVTEQKGTK